MSKTFLSKFTPSMMTKENLRAIFVQREFLLGHILEGLQESVSNGDKHHYLLAGPRGIGKTHFISLISYALKEMKEYPNQFQIAWLREDEWGVSSFLDLVVRILRSLADQSDEKKIANAIEWLIQMPAETADQLAQETLLQVLDSRTLIILAENLDSIFAGIGNIGQKRLRSLIQESGKISIVASTPLLFADIQLQSSPFYGFFEVHHLNELSIQEAKGLFLKIAALEKDQALINFLNTTEGKARIQAIYHLAGGNHRVYLILGHFLRGNNLDQLVELMLELIDDLTPYYQSQISALSNQQQKIIDVICDRQQALPVKEIASRCFISQQTTSSQLKDLKNRRLVTSMQVGREQWYEIREPLMRICLSTKKQRGKPIELLVELLRTWYSTRELKEIAALAEPNNQLSSIYLKEAWLQKITNPTLSKIPNERSNAKVATLNKTIQTMIESNNTIGLTEALKSLTTIRGTADDWSKYAYGLTITDQLFLALDAIETSLRLEKTSRSRILHLVILMKLGRYEESLTYTQEWLDLDGSNAVVQALKGSILAVIDRLDEALQIFKDITAAEPANSQAWSLLGGTFIKLRQFDDAINAFDKALETDAKNTHALVLKGYICGFRAQHEQASRCFYAALKIAPDDETAWLGLCMALLSLDDYAEALNAAESAVNLDSESISAKFYRLLALFCNRKWKEYETELELLLRISTENHTPVGDYGALLRIFLSKNLAAEVWQTKSKELLQTCQRHNVLVQLATGLLNTLPTLISDTVNKSRAGEWVEVWEKLTTHSEAFAVPLRLLRVGLEYKQTGNLEATRILVKEERDLFEQLLKEVTDYQPGQLFDKTLSNF